METLQEIRDYWKSKGVPYDALKGHIIHRFDMRYRPWKVIPLEFGDKHCDCLVCQRVRSLRFREKMAAANMRLQADAMPQGASEN